MGRAGLRLAARCIASLALVALVPALFLLGPAGGRDGGDARLVATATHGSFTQANSRDGLPIFAIGALAPGGSVGGGVTLRNTGRLAGEFTLSARDLVDVPGAGGGTLSERLWLTISEVGGPAGRRTVYEGDLRSMPPRPLGAFGPGEARSFEFVAALPDGGVPAGTTAGDNVFQGARASVRYVWNGTAPSPPPARDRRSPRLRVDLPRVQRIFHRGHLVARIRCDERCRVEARGRLRAGRRSFGVPRVRVNVAAKRARTLRIRIPARQRRAMLRALKRGKPVRLHITLTATDRAGNRAVARYQLRVRAQRSGPSGRIAAVMSISPRD